MIRMISARESGHTVMLRHFHLFDTMMARKGDRIMTDFELARQIAKEIRTKHQESVLPFTLEEGEAGLFESKAGGTPYLPHDMAWPSDGENHPMLLLAQVNCSALESLPNFPHTGLLQFFIASDDVYGMDFDDMLNQKGFRVIYHEMVDTSVTPDEVLAKRPQESEEYEICTPFERGESYRICFLAPKAMKLTVDDFRFDALFVAEWNRRRPDAPVEKEAELHQRLKEQDPDYGWDVFEALDDGEDEDYDEKEESVHHQIGGYPYFTQSDPRWNADPELSDLDVVLFQLDSDFRPESRDYLVCWGDVGVANFFISKEALKKRDFSKVAYNWDCC